MMKRACGHVFIVLFLILHVSLFLFPCIHWQNAWSLLAWIPLIIAFIAPSCCQNYTRMPSELLSSNLNYDDFQSCREFGWIFTFFIGMCAYLVPVLTWYNTPFPIWGVMFMFGGILTIHWAYLIWLRMYILI